MQVMESVTQMRKGLVEHCVMALLAEREHYGYELVQRLSAVDGMLTGEGTVYPLLARLKREGLVDTVWRESAVGPPRKYYALTAGGRAGLAGFRQEWARLKAAVDFIIGGGGKS